MAVRTDQAFYESSRARCENELVNEVQLIIPDKAQRNVLLASVGPGKWRLPGFVSEDYAGTASIATLRSCVKEIIGLDFRFVVLRQAHSQELEVERTNLTAYLLRTVLVVDCCEEPEQLPRALQWVPIIEPHESRVVNVVHSEEDAEREVRQELQGIGNGVSPKGRVPWASRSWNEDITAWVQEAFRRHNLHMNGHMEQIRASAHSTVLKINTNGGCYYLKCSSCTSNDAGITSVMSAAAPQLVKKPLVVDVKRRLMIMKDHGEEFGASGLKPEACRQFMKSLATLHKTTMSELPKLVEVGLPVYSPKWMADNFDALLNAKEFAFMQDSDLSKSLHSIKKEVIDALMDIASWEMPDCLVHNDAMEGNLTRSVGEEGTGFQFFDFGSSFASHPVFDLTGYARGSLEAYAEEMGITDMDRWDKLSNTAYKVKSLVEAFRYIERVRAAEEGGVRNDELVWLEYSFDSLTSSFK